MNTIDNFENNLDEILISMEFEAAIKEKYNSFIDNLLVSLESDNMNTEDNLYTENLFVQLWTPDKNNLMSKGISAFTKSKYSHASLCLNKNHKEIYEMQMKIGKDFGKPGLNIISLLDKQSVNREVDIFKLSITEFQKKHSIKILSQIQDQKDDIYYNTVALAKIFVGRIYKSAKSNYNNEAFTQNYLLGMKQLICSSLVVGILLNVSPKIRYHIKQMNLKWEYISPEQISQLPGLEFVKTIDLNKNVSPQLKSLGGLL